VLICFSLMSRWCSFIMYINHSPGFFEMYTFSQERDILYTPAELSGDLWFLGFLKICSIFLGGLKTIWMLYLFNPVDTVRYFFYIWENGKSSFVCFILWWLYIEIHCLTSVCWLFYLYLFYHVRSFIRFVSDGWVSCIGQRWRKLYVQVNW